MHHYLAELDFRYNTRELKDGGRALIVVKQSEEKRLMLRDSLTQRPR